MGCYSIVWFTDDMMLIIFRMIVRIECNVNLTVVMDVMI
jgi:hypothetical protein